MKFGGWSLNINKMKKIFFILLPYFFKNNKKQIKDETSHIEAIKEKENIEQINFPTIQMWREIIMFGNYGQTERIRSLHKYYNIVRTDNGFVITKRQASTEHINTVQIT